MKRTLSYALSAVLLSAFVGVAYGQDNFPDVPDNHWAYEALARMKKEGLLIGYPDGLYRGSRPATRYELAVATHAVYQALKNLTDGLDKQIAAVEEKQGGGSGGDLDSLKAALEGLKADVAAVKGYGDDIDALKKMTATFEKELSSMGVDVEAMKQSLSNLDARVKALEARKPTVDIHGDVNLFMLNGYSQNGTFGITTDGRPVGVGSGSYGTAGGTNTLDGAARVGMDRDWTVLEEGALTLKGTNDEGPKWWSTFVIGNMIGMPTPDAGGIQRAPFGAQSGGAAGVPFTAGQTDVYLQSFGMKFSTSVAKLGFDANVGRVGYKVSPYIFQRPDNTPYYHNARWDNGEWTTDGGVLTFKFGKVGLDLVAGKDGGSTSVGNSTSYNTSPTAIQPLTAGALTAPFIKGGARPRGFVPGLITVDHHYGAVVNVPLMGKGTLDLAYLWLMSNNVVGGANGVNVFGGDLKLDLGKVGVKAGYSKSDVVRNNHNVTGGTKNNDAYYGEAALGHGKWDLSLGYRQINPLFAAPGSWGHIGIWWNPTDIKGGYGAFKFQLSEKLGLHVDGGAYTGTGKATGGLTTGDKLNHVNVGVNYAVAPTTHLSLGAELVEWNLKAATGFTAGKPVERWYDIGLGFDLGNRSVLRFLWQISDYQSKGVTGFNPFAGSANANAKGGLLTTQLSVRF